MVVEDVQDRQPSLLTNCDHAHARTSRAVRLADWPGADRSWATLELQNTSVKTPRVFRSSGPCGPHLVQRS